LASLITALGVPVLHGVGFALLLRQYGEGAADLPVALMAMLIALPFSAAGMFIVGLPLVMLLRSRGWLSGPAMCVLGALVGVLMANLSAGLADGAWLSRWASGVGALTGLPGGLLFACAAGTRWWPLKT
jgi:hypothetical protein